MTENRNIRNIADNKTGPKPKVDRNDIYTLKTFIFKLKFYTKRIKGNLHNIF